MCDFNPCINWDKQTSQCWWLMLTSRGLSKPSTQLTPILRCVCVCVCVCGCGCVCVGCVWGVCVCVCLVLFICSYTIPKMYFLILLPPHTLTHTHTHTHAHTHTHTHARSLTSSPATSLWGTCRVAGHMMKCWTPPLISSARWSTASRPGCRHCCSMDPEVSSSSLSVCLITSQLVYLQCSSPQGYECPFTQSSMYHISAIRCCPCLMATLKYKAHTPLEGVNEINTALV